MTVNPKSNVLFVFSDGRSELLAQSRSGRAPDEFLYGLPYLTEPSYDVRYVEDAQPYQTISEVIWLPLQRWFARRFTLGFNFHAYRKHLHAIRAADVIITTKDSYGLPILWKKYSGEISAKVVYISQGLYEVAETAIGNRLNAKICHQIGKWLRAAEAVVVFGEGDARALQASFGDNVQLDIHTIFFGIDEKFWTPGEGEAGSELSGEDYLLSVGSDWLRDYPLLLDAIGEQPLRIVTRQRFEPAALKPNVAIKSDLDWMELREWYRKAAFVITPIKNAPRNSGHSATLQAMASGKAVILSDTPGLWDRKRMRHMETCYLVEPENVEAMRTAIEFLNTHPEEVKRIGCNARRLVEQEYSSQRFGDRLQACIQSLL